MQRACLGASDRPRRPGEALKVTNKTNSVSQRRAVHLRLTPESCTLLLPPARPPCEPGEALLPNPTSWGAAEVYRLHCAAAAAAAAFSLPAHAFA